MRSVVAVKRRDSWEFILLIKSLGYHIEQIIEFSGEKNPKFYMGKGKVEEIKELVSKDSLVLVDAILKSSQWFNLENELGVEVKDRVGLIIDIFADRAKSREAMLQVDYARLKYEIPLIREMIHHSRLGEHAGWHGAGEYEIADYYEMIRRRMSKIEKKLDKIKLEREERRKWRRREGFVLVGIAGYTNAGKTTLLNALTSTGRIAEERMFSTLSTKTSRLGRERVLITDTVGFVEGMPPWLIRAFEPTLEEIYSADIVLLLLDGSDSVDEFKRKLEVSQNIIESKIHGKLIPVINKIDKASIDELEQKIAMLNELPEPVLISARNNLGLSELVRRIFKEAELKEYTLTLNDSSLLNYIRRFGKIEDIKYDECVNVKFSMRQSFYEQLIKKLNKRSNGKEASIEGK